MPNNAAYSSKYETLLAVGQLGGWEYNVLTQELWCNTYYFEMLGRKDQVTADWACYSIKEVWENWLHPEDLAKAKEYFADFILNPEKDYAQQLRMLHANGEWVTILSRALAMRNELGDLNGMIIGTHLDITENKQLSDNFTITQKEYEKSKKQVVKDNALINASYNLDLVEQRLILLAIVEARESGKGINANDPLEVHAEGYINQFGVARQTAYQALKDACKDLFARQFSYQEKRERGRANITSRWVSQIAYIDETATVEVIFAPAVVPLITRLEKQFSKYDIEQISSLSSAYAVRLYELLICWRTTGKTPVIDLTEFRKRIGVLDTEYQRMDVFKRGVLELALKQVNEHTDITATYEQHKKGRVITGFSFKFKQKKPKQAEIATETPKTATNDLDTIKPLTEPQIAKYSMILCKLGSISDLSNFPDYPTFANWIGNILRSPEKADEQTAKRIFTALKTETDYGKKNV